MSVEDLERALVDYRELENQVSLKETQLAEERARYTADMTQATADITELGEELAGLEDENARLRAQIEELGGESVPPPPPPPAGVDTWLGATINTRNGQTYAQAVAAWESTRGPLGVLRTFNGGLPSTFTASNSSSQMRNRHRIVSVKGEASAAYWDTYIASIPQDKNSFGEPCITGLVVNHEPENDGTAMTPTVFKRRCDLMQQRVAASGRTDIIAGLVLMTWLERDNNAGTSSKDWFPSRPSEFFLFLDPYDPNGDRTGETQTKETLRLWRAAGGVWWGITETGSHRTGAELAAWVTAYLTWCHNEKASFVIWFHSAVGAAAGPTGWWLDDPAGIAAWKAKAPVMRAA